MSGTYAIVIPTHNCADYVARAIDSALDQTRPAERIIVVDDGSTDTTPHVLERYAGRVHGYRQEQQGPFLACQRGIELAGQVERIVFLDADDRLRPGYLRAMSEAFEGRPDAGAAFGTINDITQDGRTRRTSCPEISGERLDIFRAYVRGELELHAGGAVFSRWVFDPWLKRSELVGRIHGFDRVLVGSVLALHPVLSVPSAEVEIHDRPGRLRLNLASVSASSLEAVDVLFDPGLLPSEALMERDVFYRRLLLEQARLFYRAGRFGEALERYSCVRAMGASGEMSLRHHRRYWVCLAASGIRRSLGVLGKRQRNSVGKNA